MVAIGGTNHRGPFSRVVLGARRKHTLSVNGACCLHGGREGVNNASFFARGVLDETAG